MRFQLHIEYDLRQFGVQIIEIVVFLLYFRLPDPNQGIQTYKHFWLGIIILLHLALLHLALSATQILPKQ